MEPGLENPLGARALYLYTGGRDTMYRIHGTNEPSSIGENVSSGCVRMFNQDVIDLHDRTPVGAQVLVRPSVMPAGVAGSPAASSHDRPRPAHRINRSREKTDSSAQKQTSIPVNLIPFSRLLGSS